MRALHWDGTRLELRRNHPEPALEPGMARVRVALAGICSTDLQILRGYLGFSGIPGHEVVGRVVDGPEELVGRGVVAEINFACRRCTWCSRGLGRHCPDRRTMGIVRADGSLADLVAVPIENLHPVPAGVADEEAVFVEPLAAAFEMLEQVEVRPGMSAIVLGDGKLGLLCAQVLAGAGARVTLVGKHEAKLELARNLGLEAVHVDDPRPQRVDLVVEATGSTAGLETALETVRPRGTVILKSTVAGDHSLSLARVVIDEITVLGSRCGPFVPALDALARGVIRVTPLVERVFSLDAGVEAMAAAARPGALKILVDCR
jgi:threonine dehydrogenase-like Zn-dependent dehydrogenase